jgi:hypothetical protein
MWVVTIKPHVMKPTATRAQVPCTVQCELHLLPWAAEEQREVIQHTAQCGTSQVNLACHYQADYCETNAASVHVHTQIVLLTYA